EGTVAIRRDVNGDIVERSGQLRARHVFDEEPSVFGGMTWPILRKGKPVHPLGVESAPSGGVGLNLPTTYVNGAGIDVHPVEEDQFTAVADCSLERGRRLTSESDRRKDNCRSTSGHSGEGDYPCATLE